MIFSLYFPQSNYLITLFPFLFPFAFHFPIPDTMHAVNTYDHNTAVVLLPCSDASEESDEEDDDSDSYEQRRRRTKLSP